MKDSNDCCIWILSIEIGATVMLETTTMIPQGEVLFTTTIECRDLSFERACKADVTEAQSS